MGALRDGFRRYIFAIQYHGPSFLGFTIQRDCYKSSTITNTDNNNNTTTNNNNTMHRNTNVVSVEYRIRLALSAMLHDNIKYVNSSTKKKESVQQQQQQQQQVVQPQVVQPQVVQPQVVQPQQSHTEEEEEQYENLQVSSRTDRGVHAMKNTFHVDIRITEDNDSNNYDNNDDNNSNENYDTKNDKNMKRMYLLDNTHRMVRSLNYYLQRTNPHDNHNNYYSVDYDDTGLHNDLNHEKNSRDEDDMGYSHNDTTTTTTTNDDDDHHHNHFSTMNYYSTTNSNNTIRILSCQIAPTSMPNSDIGIQIYHQPHIVDWNARFSAKSRTYVYRILYMNFKNNGDDDENNNNDDDENSNRYDVNYAIPFEYDRAWIIQGFHRSKKRQEQRRQQILQIEQMKLAASYLIGTHDFTTFRASNCQRQTPIMTLYDISIQEQPYYNTMFGTLSHQSENNYSNMCSLITIRYKGDSFLYRQVRKMTACLMAVGCGKISNPITIQHILQYKDTKYTSPYGMAPPQGLFLVDVEHEGIQI